MPRRYRGQSLDPPISPYKVSSDEIASTYQFYLPLSSLTT